MSTAANRSIVIGQSICFPTSAPHRWTSPVAGGRHGRRRSVLYAGAGAAAAHPNAGIVPLELAKVVLEHIERLNPVINAFLTIPSDLALEQAKAAEARVMRGSPSGPLEGIPYSVKDLEPTAGVRTTYGSKWFEHNIPAEDGAVAGGSGGPAEFSSAKRTRPTSGTRTCATT